MSEFYSERRTSIKDITGLLAFIAGWLGSAPFAWKYIKGGFEGGDPTVGVLRFALVVFTAAIVCGVLGLALGAVAGWIWERVHRRRRAKHPRAAMPERRELDSIDRAEMAAAAEKRPPLPPIAYEGRDVSAAEYIALMGRFAENDLDKKRIAKALKITVNVGAWDGERLVGIARVLTDGYYAAALAEIIVDPDYQRRGMGRELMNRAHAATPRGTLSVSVPAGATHFFDKIGCERGSTGFTMRRAARRNGA